MDKRTTPAQQDVGNGICPDCLSAHPATMDCTLPPIGNTHEEAHPMTPAQLKSCPFCGDPMNVECRFKNSEGEIWRVVHTESWRCWTVTDKTFASEAEAIAAFNQRHVQEAESELVSKLEKLAQWCDQSQHDKWCTRKEVPIRGFSGEGIIVRQAADHITRLEAALREAINWFDEYADQHAAKSTQTSDSYEQSSRVDKAKRNRERADELRTALGTTTPKTGD